MQNDIQTKAHEITEIKAIAQRERQKIFALEKKVIDLQTNYSELQRQGNQGSKRDNGSRGPRDERGPKGGKAYIADCGEHPSLTGAITIMTEGDSPRAFSVYCKRGWTYIFKRFDGSINFTRPWADYKRGFGETMGEYFIGLDNLASLLKERNFKARFELTTWPPATPSSGYAEYSNFSIADESYKYRLSISGYSGTAGDSMQGYHNGRQFTTYDQDNDHENSGNCAITYKGAWWYNGCHQANLFGIYARGPICPSYATMYGLVTMANVASAKHS
ncbi:unnamed protein product [Owenia fusiformis]|uniref:Fibrinogen C-terminal domain-containing protein n=1 Tax=Owenia fusiformis TaxID=6347 RepID=A0A8S4Q5L8_OWEFU|nr:unnamed protein product [Owenia fusiformis]